ncbi:MAG: hypothetical protein IT281_00415 [Ignavibacteria bacterium]|nr:hypothetical protein [Ignavibacteria bacterium]MCC7157980.1 hypothetical protein [Ignavibacteria bacterium]
MPEISEYKGNKLICLNPGSKFTFSFGLSKAKMILENLDSIKKFVETNGESCGDDTAAAGGEGSQAEPF